MRAYCLLLQDVLTAVMEIKKRYSVRRKRHTDHMEGSATTFVMVISVTTAFGSGIKIILECL